MSEANSNTYNPATDSAAAPENAADNSGKRKKLGDYIKYKRFKWYHIVLAILVLIVVSLFVGWNIMPSRVLNVAVMDKTVLSYSEDENIVKDTVYRKHRGFFYLLNQQKYVKADGTNYDFSTDYFGPMLDEDGAPDKNVELKNIGYQPNLVYLSDAYGMGNDTYGYFNGGSPENAGINSDDMSVISYAYESGATIIGETTLFSSPLSDSVYTQLSTMFGVKPKRWIGRYIVDLQDFTDVPDWAVPMYEQQEGVEWRFTGPGILLVSAEGKILILEQNTDFHSQDLLTVYVNEKYKDEFSGLGKVNFYNWFELIETNYGTENIATFEFDLNEVGMKKIKDLSKSPRFCAVARKQEKNHAPVYYFSGDFNDYVSGDRYGNFLFSNEFFRFLSFDRQGDISHFYWNFYNPLMLKILSQTESTKFVEESEEHKEVSRVNNGTFQILEDKKWKSLNMKAVSVNAVEPGKKTYSRDFTFYEELVNSASKLGANCIVAKDLLPPEFYTAVSRYNKEKKNIPIYIMQRIPAPDGLKTKDYLSEDGLAKWKNAVKTIVDAVHGKTSAKSEKLGEASYFTDVSKYLLSVTVDPDLDDCSVIEGLDGYNYSGKYVKQSSGINGFAAYLYDMVETCSQKYGYYTPASVSAKLERLTGMSFVKKKNTYLFTGIENESCAQYYFNDIEFSREALKNTGVDSGEYDSIQAALTEVTNTLPSVVLSGISYSNVSACYKDKAVTEGEQGRKIVEALSSVRDTECIGATVYDLNDCWTETSDKMAQFTAGGGNSHMWQNVCDESQMTGLVAMDGKKPSEEGLVLTDDDLVQAISLSSDTGYMYITLQLFSELDYDSTALFVGLDTFQRNDGEYFYAKKFTPNSLSGMEFVLRFDDKQNAALYVTNAYDRSDGKAFTKESYNANYKKVCDLVYGGFQTGDTQFYQTGSTIYTRIPWTWLNVADPAQKLVINDKNPSGNRLKTASTNGVLPSVMIGERKSGDLVYGFPETKHDPGYKVFKWNTWESVEYELRNKNSFTILKNYFSDNQR